MSDMRMKKLILEVVNNQLRDNDPPVTKQTYQKLLELGYSPSEAKEKIGAVLMEEIYDIMKENKPHDEERYREALLDLVRKCEDFEDDGRIFTEWDEWDDFAQRGYEAQEKGNESELLDCWWKAWKIFQDILGQEERKYSVSELMEEQDFRYPVDAWLQDMEMELGNLGEHEKRTAFCRAVLELMDWSLDDDSNFRSAIGEELYAAGKIEEGKAWFENWLKTIPDCVNGWLAYSWCVQEQEGTEAAYDLIRDKVAGKQCTWKNEMLFERAKLLAEHLEQEEDCKYLEQQISSCRNAMRKADVYNDMYDDFRLPVQEPVKKEKKIYPNDPCPCGSGKKYKKCCGKNRR